MIKSDFGSSHAVRTSVNRRRRQNDASDMEIQYDPKISSRQTADSFSIYLPNGASMQEPNSEFVELPPDLMPIHHLLRQAAEQTPFPEPPEHLYHQTLERCLGSRPSSQNRS